MAISDFKMEFRWDWLDNGGEAKNWTPFDDKIQDILNDAVKNKKKNAKFDINGTNYEVQLGLKMLQKNLKTGYERPIRMCIHAEPTTKTTTTTTTTDDENSDSNADKKADNNRWHYWQWMNDANKWISYPPQIAIDLEAHYNLFLNDSKTKAHNSLKVEIPESKANYIIDFQKMAQINAKSSFIRNVKRVPASDITNNKATVVATTDAPISSNLRKRKSLTSNPSNASTIALSDEDEENSVPKKMSTKKVKSEPKPAAVVDKRKKKDEEEESEEEEVVAASSKKSAASNTKSKGRGRKKVKKEEVDVDVEEEEEEDKDVKVKDEPENVKVVNFSGEVPLDEKFVETVGSGYRIYKENGVIYDCMLNQLMESTTSKQYVVWMRWGRVGKVGQVSIERLTDINKAKHIFEKKFKDKTANDWADKDEFVKEYGKYDLVVKDYDTSSNESVDPTLKKTSSATDSTSVDEKPIVAKSKLHKSIQELIEMICNVQEMESMLKEMKYDAKKAPLGKLGKNQIKAGYAALKEIEALIKANKTSGREMTEANNDFYTRIPHDFGMRVPPIINTMSEVRLKVKLLELLDDIEVAIKALAQKSDLTNPIDHNYEQLECELKPLSRDSDTFKLIEEYIKNTHGQTHNNYSLKLIDVFEAERPGEVERFVDHGNRMLLWHGSRVTNWAGILSQGLRIAPPEAPVTGYMFGKGVYFSDCCSKSANYCYTSSNKNIGILSLSEVSLGATNDLKQADYNADKLPKGKMSTKGLGRNEPDKSQWKTLENGCVVPCGKIKSAVSSQEANQCALLYNEYIVYNENQIKLKYIVKVEFVYDE